MKVRWPPAPLGLGPPLNLALLSSGTRPLVKRSLWIPPVIGLFIATAMYAVDYLFFGGVTVRDTPDLSSHPSVGARFLISLIGSLAEDLVFRVGAATLAAWVVYLGLRRVRENPRAEALWVGVVVGALTAGWMHVSLVADPTRFWRIMILNFIGNAVYSWLYFHRGFEIALFTHVVVTASLYIGVPALR